MGSRTFLAITTALAVLLLLPVIGEKAGMRVRADDVASPSTSPARTLTLPSPGVPGEGRLQIRGCADLPENVVRGLSGITRIGDSSIYWGAMDNSDRLVKLQIDL